MKMHQGLKTAILYSLPPHQLGFCGPKNKTETKKLLAYSQESYTDEKAIRKILKKFTSAFVYYDLIAKYNHILDSFDEKVVRAYWIGNQLLDNVSISDLRETIALKFNLPEKARAIPINSKPHHSFHVNIIGSVSGRIKFTDKLRTLCKISHKKIGNQYFSLHWGEVCEKLGREDIENLKKYTY